MAWKISTSTLDPSNGEPAWWKNEYGPADKVPVSGIYKCTGCKKEITSNAGDPFPPQNHHQHTLSLGPVRWKLNIRTNTDGD
jgi:hypothetical protein